MQPLTQNFLEKIEVTRLESQARIPTRAHEDDAGLDLYSLEDVFLEAGQGERIRTGVALALPTGFVGMIADRSSLAKRGLKTAGGIIDSGYRGEIQILVWNLSSEALHVQGGDRVAQLLILPIATPQPIEVASLDLTTTRGKNGFGSSGK
jgi:dUTP pyrophosphatase